MIRPLDFSLSVLSSVWLSLVVFSSVSRRRSRSLLTSQLTPNVTATIFIKRGRLRFSLRRRGSPLFGRLRSRWSLASTALAHRVLFVDLLTPPGNYCMRNNYYQPTRRARANASSWDVRRNTSELVHAYIQCTIHAALC